jgi:transmembrane 9 superfamily protein 3
MVEDSGWKQVHGDVFRPPTYLCLFSAFLGAGCQLLVVAIGCILFAIAGPMHGDVYEERGEAITSSIVCYTLSSIVSG